MKTLKAGQFCPHLPPFGSNNSIIQAFFPTFSPKGLKANGQKALFTLQKCRTSKLSLSTTGQVVGDH